MSHHDFELGMHSNPTDQQITDAIRLLTLRRLTSVALKFERSHLSPELLELLKLVATKPLENLRLYWMPEEVDKRPHWKEDLIADIRAFEELFEALTHHGTLKMVHLTGPFAVSELFKWCRHDKLKFVEFWPNHDGRVGFNDPQNSINTFVQELKQNPRECEFRFNWDLVERNTTTIRSHLRSLYCNTPIETGDKSWVFVVAPFSRCGNLIYCFT
ncbi:hypothetical protein L596_013737 [Steinernema carpocapsae]|uniref:F-box domain-containing protein n=1 Tax=Steinernema carpocapsae TaxID=34508 RepID=A0A4U5P1T0_STECR|nr:hypothetical protein L596_013737 [Steinernema carpocapsae]